MKKKLDVKTIELLACDIANREGIKCGVVLSCCVMAVPLVLSLAWTYKHVKGIEPPVCKVITLEYPSGTAKAITWIDGQWGYSTTESTLVARSAYACKPLTSGEKPPIIWDETLP